MLGLHVERFIRCSQKSGSKKGREQQRGRTSSIRQGKNWVSGVVRKLNLVPCCLQVHLLSGRGLTNCRGSREGESEGPLSPPRNSGRLDSRPLEQNNQRLRVKICGVKQGGCEKKEAKAARGNRKKRFKTGRRRAFTASCRGKSPLGCSKIHQGCRRRC